MLRKLFKFPDPVNENAARVVAGGVVLLSMAYMIFAWQPLLYVLAYGFLARALSGPRFSPLGLLATRVIAPHLPVKYCPGPPKRFAQAVGLAFSSAALILSMVGMTGWAMVVVGLLLAAATLESVLGLCLGCKIFGLLMKLGLIPDEVCQRCQDIWA